MKFPKDGTTDLASTTGNGFQLRAGASISPLNIYKGVVQNRVGEADCAQYLARAQLVATLDGAMDTARLSALRAQAAFFEASAEERTAVGKSTQERLVAQTITFTDAAEVRRRDSAIARRQSEIEAEARRLGLRAVELPVDSAGALLRNAQAASANFEEQVSKGRALDAWTFDVLGGVVPSTGKLDTFGVAQVGFNFGAFARSSAEARYRQARKDEEATGPGQLADQLRRFRAELAIAKEQTLRELAVVERDVESVAAVKANLTQASGGSPHAFAVLSLERILLTGEKVYLTALLSQLQRMEVWSHDA
jgi:hypothetical protein